MNRRGFTESSEIVQKLGPVGSRHLRERAAEIAQFPRPIQFKWACRGALDAQTLHSADVDSETPKETTPVQSEFYIGRDVQKMRTSY